MTIELYYNYSYKQHSLINCNVAGCFPEKLWLNRSAREVKYNKRFEHPEDWILRYLPFTFTIILTSGAMIFLFCETKYQLLIRAT